MERFIHAMIRHQWIVCFVAVLIAVAGAWSILQTPIDALPDLSENQILVYTSWPGNKPQTIETRITKPLSRSLQGIEGLVTIRGSSESHFSLLHLLFDDSKSFRECRQLVADKLDTIKLDLPTGVAPQLAAEGIPTGQIFWYTVEGIDTDLVELRDIQQRLVAPQLRKINGVAEVATVGGFEPETHFQLDLVRLSQTKLTISDVEALWRSGDNAALQALNVGKFVIGTAPRVGVFEKNGSESVAGLVHLKFGHNPLQVTRDVLDAMQSLADSLPANIRLAPCYDRTSLIEGAVRTVTWTLLESMLVATICVLLVLRHLRTSLVISLTLPLAVLAAFLMIAMLRWSGQVEIQTNIMSLAGIVVSIGVLVDSAIVITDSVSHDLHERFGKAPVAGDTSQLVAKACAKVAWPAFLAIIVMLISFLPVFALQGIDGRMYGPLAWTKALSLISVAVLTVTVVPVMCHVLIRGRVRCESESAIVSGFSSVYRPLLNYLLDHPLPLIAFLGMTIVIGAAATGVDWLVRGAVGLGLAGVWFAARSRLSAGFAILLVLLVGLSATKWIKPIGLELRVPLDEGMVMDMPITVPNIPISQAVDDLKARNMILCRFPEVAMVSGKAGRAETAFDPAPLDMIETMVEFRSTDLWPSRRMRREDARAAASEMINSLQVARLIAPVQDLDALAKEITEAGLLRFDAVMREVCWQRLCSLRIPLGRELAIEIARHVATGSEATLRGMASEIAINDCQRLGELPDRLSVAAIAKKMTSHERSVSRDDELYTRLKAIWTERQRLSVKQLNAELRDRAAGTWLQIVCSECVSRTPIIEPALQSKWEQILDARYGVTLASANSSEIANGSSPPSLHQHNGIPSIARLPIIDPHPKYDLLVSESTKRLAGKLWLWPHDRSSLTGSGGELDMAVQMLGWANVWTRPIQNRVDMLASGVNSEVGVRVLGDDFDAIVNTSEAIAEVIGMISGAENVIADPIRGKEEVQFVPDARRFAELGLDETEAQSVFELAKSGRVLAPPLDSGLKPRRLLIISPAVDSLGILTVTSGPASIKSENGSLRNYVRFNVRGRQPQDVIDDAKLAIAKNVPLPAGVSIQWTGQYEHATRTRATLLWMIPLVVTLIGVVLYAVFRDAVDACLMLIAVPGALAGGVVCQWLLGYPFSVAVGIGYIACFGMAAATSMIMLVYMRESVTRAGALSDLSTDELRLAVIDGAVHRLRPKLLTEATMILALAPMLWSSGAGADIIRPMAAPVLGGILIADEVVDLLIPLLFYASRRQRQLQCRI